MRPGPFFLSAETPPRWLRRPTPCSSKPPLLRLDYRSWHQCDACLQPRDSCLLRISIRILNCCDELGGYECSPSGEITSASILLRVWASKCPNHERPRSTQCLPQLCNPMAAAPAGWSRVPLAPFPIWFRARAVPRPLPCGLGSPQRDR